MTSMIQNRTMATGNALGALMRASVLAIATTFPLFAQDVNPGEAAAFARVFADYQLEALTGTAWTSDLHDLREELHAAVLDWPEDAALADVLVEVEAAWFERVALAGDPASAEAAITSLEAAIASTRAADGGNALARARARLAERPEVAAVLDARAKAREARPATAPARADEALSEVITTALRQGFVSTLYSLGRSAVEPLTALALASDGAPWVRGTFDGPGAPVSPLLALLQIDLAAGLDVAATVLERKDLLTKSEVARALRESMAFQGDTAWIPRSDGTSELENPRWASIVTALIQEPAVLPAELAPTLSGFVEHGVMPREWFQTCAEIQGFTIEYKSISPPPQIVELGRYLLEHGSSSARQNAARYFLTRKDASPVLSLAGVPEAWAYSAVSAALGPRTVVHDDLFGATTSLETLPEVDDAFCAAVVALGELRKTLGELPEFMSNLIELAGHGAAYWLPTKTLVELQRSEILPGQTIRLALAMGGARETDAVQALLTDWSSRRAIGSETAAALITSFAADSVEIETFWTGHEVFSRIADKSEALTRQLLLQPLRAVGGRPREILRALDVIDAALADPDRSEMVSTLPLEELVKALIKPGAAGEAHGKILARVAAWPGVELQRLALRGLSTEDWMEILTNERAAVANRGIALRELHRISSPSAPTLRGLSPLIADLASSGVWLPPNLDQAGADEADILARLMASASVPDDVLLRVDLSKMPDSETALEILERFPPNSVVGHEQPMLVRNALRHAYLAGDVPSELVVQYVEKNRAIADSAASLVPDSEDPGRVEVLRAALGVVDTRVSEIFLSLISRVGDDAAARALLDAARNLYSPLREQAMAEFENLMKWREAEARIRSSSVRTTTQETAVSALVETLDSSTASAEQRVEAVRGLGLLGAAEELPRLIALLEDSVLGPAARKAIDALHDAAEKQ